MPVVDRQKERQIVERARQRGWGDEQIRQAVTAFRSQAGGIQAVPEAQAAQPAQKPGFLASIAAPFTKTLATGLGAIEGIGTLAGEAMKPGKITPEGLRAAETAATRERDFGVFGTSKPIGADISATEGVGSALGKFAKPVIGTGLELGSYAAPVGVAKGAGQATRFLSKLGAGARAGAKFGALGGGMQAGGRELAQEGSTLGSVAKKTLGGSLAGGVVGGTLPVAGAIAAAPFKAVGKGLGMAREALGEAVTAGEKSDLSSRLVNSVIKPLEKEFRFGRDPGRTVVEELANTGTKANTREQLARFITESKNGVGKEIEAALTDPSVANKKINISGAVRSIDSAIQKAAESGDELLMGRLQSVKDGLEYTFKQKGGRLRKSAPKSMELTPKEAQAVKRQIGEAMRWTGQAFDNDVNQARATIYREIDKLIDAAVPGIDRLNDRYGGLLSAEKSIERTMNVGQRGQTLSMGDIVTGGIGGAAFGGPGAILSAIGRRFIESTPFKTRLAVLLRKHGVEASLEEMLAKTATERSEALKKLPVVARMEAMRIIEAAEKGIRAAAVQETSRTSREKSPVPSR